MIYNFNNKKNIHTQSLLNILFLIGILGIIITDLPGRYINSKFKYLFFHRTRFSVYPFFFFSVLAIIKLVKEKKKKELFIILVSFSIYLLCSLIISLFSFNRMLEDITVADVDLLTKSIRNKLYYFFKFKNFNTNLFFTEILFDLFSNICIFKEIYLVVFCIFFVYKDNLNSLVNLFIRAFVISFVFVIIYETIELPYLIGVEKASNILSVINPYLYDIKFSSNWWPPLLWPNQLRGPFAEPSFFGYYLGVSVCVFTYTTFTNEKPINFLFLFCSFLFAFLTNSRTGIMLAIGGELVFLFFALISGKEKKKILFIILIVILALILAEALSVFDINELKEKNSEIIETAKSISSPTARSNISRYSYTKATFEIGKEHFLCGVGSNYIGTYIAEKMKKMNLISSEMERWIAKQDAAGKLNSIYPILNYYTYLLASGGIISIVLYLGLFVYELILYLMFIIKNGFKSLSMFSIMIISMFAVIFAMGFSNSLMISYIYVIAMGIGLCDLYQLNALKFFKKPQTVNEVVVSD